MGRAVTIVVVVVVAAAAAFGGYMTADAKTPRFPRAADGKPDLSGVWQALSTAAWNLEDHTASDRVPAGQSVVVGGQIPYKPEALEKKREHERSARIPDPLTTVTADPLSKCYLPGVPRAVYLPYPFEIAQTDRAMVMNFEFARTSRVIPTDGRPHEKGLYSWMGDARGHWEGDTFVVDTTDFNDQTWFDQAGNYHSDALHVVERFTPMDRDHLQYEATIEDPNVFTKPWTIRMPLYRRLEPNVQALEYHCLEFLEPKIYGPYTKPGTK